MNKLFAVWYFLQLQEYEGRPNVRNAEVVSASDKHDAIWKYNILLTQRGNGFNFSEYKNVDDFRNRFVVKDFWGLYCYEIVE